GGRLSGAVRPEQREDLAAVDVQIDTLHGLDVAVRLPQSGDVDHALAHGGTRLGSGAGRDNRSVAGRESQPLVDDVAEGLSQDPALYLVVEHTGEFRLPAAYVARHVRTDDHAGQIPQRALRWERLLLEDVEGRTRDLPGEQRFDQGGLVHRRATPDVDEPRGGLH